MFGAGGGGGWMVSSLWYRQHGFHVAVRAADLEQSPLPMWNVQSKTACYNGGLFFDLVSSGGGSKISSAVRTKCERGVNFQSSFSTSKELSRNMLQGQKRSVYKRMNSFLLNASVNISRKELHQNKPQWWRKTTLTIITNMLTNQNVNKTKTIMFSTHIYTIIWKYIYMTNLDTWQALVRIYFNTRFEGGRELVLYKCVTLNYFYISA